MNATTPALRNITRTQWRNMDDATYIAVSRHTNKRLFRAWEAMMSEKISLDTLEAITNRVQAEMESARGWV